MREIEIVGKVVVVPCNIQGETIMQTNIANIRQRWAKAKLTKMAVFWIVTLAILITLFLGFTRGGWMTGGNAEQLSEGAAQTAVVERLSTICVAQFDQDAQKDEKLAELQAITSSYRRTTYVAEQGWATMPGESVHDNEVAKQCAGRLMRLDE